MKSNRIFSFITIFLTLTAIVLVIARPYWDNDHTMGGIQTAFLVIGIIPFIILSSAGSVVTYLRKKIKNQSLSMFDTILFYIMLSFIVIGALAVKLGFFI